MTTFERLGAFVVTLRATDPMAAFQAQTDLAALEAELAAERSRVISVTYGELYGAYPEVAAEIQPHEWDNKNTVEQQAWLLERLTAERTKRQEAEQRAAELERELSETRNLKRMAIRAHAEEQEIATRMQQRAEKAEAENTALRERVRVLSEALESRMAQAMSLGVVYTNAGAEYRPGLARYLELAAERTKRQEAEGFVSDVKDCAAELFEALRDHWKVDADAMTLYLLSLSAGFAKAWAENPPKNGATHSAKFAGVGKVQIDVRRIDGKSAAESLRDAEAENAALRERVLVLREALRAHHSWQMDQTDLDQYGVSISEAYAESSLCGETIAALAASPMEPPASADATEGE